MRLLVTESDPLVRSWLGRMAAGLGVHLRFVTCGSELMAAIESERPDCVVMDASTATHEPAPLWRRLRETPETSHIPILLYSSSRRWQTLAEQAGATVDGFLPRPFTPAGMLDAAHQAACRAAA